MNASKFTVRAIGYLLLLVLAYIKATVDLILGFGLFFIIALGILVLYCAIIIARKKKFFSLCRYDKQLVFFLGLIIIFSPSIGYYYNAQQYAKVEQYARSVPEVLRNVRVVGNIYYIGDKQLENSDPVVQQYQDFKNTTSAGWVEELRNGKVMVEDSEQGMIILYRKYGLFGARVFPFYVSTEQLGSCCMPDYFWDQFNQPRQK